MSFARWLARRPDSPSPPSRSFRHLQLRPVLDDIAHALYRLFVIPQKVCVVDGFKLRTHGPLQRIRDFRVARRTVFQANWKQVERSDRSSHSGTSKRTTRPNIPRSRSCSIIRAHSGLHRLRRARLLAATASLSMFRLRQSAWMRSIAEKIGARSSVTVGISRQSRPEPSLRLL